MEATLTNITFTVPGRSSGAITVPCQIVYEGTEFEEQRINQSTQRTLDGKLVTYDNGVSIISGTIQMNAVGKDKGRELRRWIRKEAVYALRSFTISAVAGLDFGLGENTEITNVTFPIATDKGLFKFFAPGIWKINFPYDFVRVTDV